MKKKKAVIISIITIIVLAIIIVSCVILINSKDNGEIQKDNSSSTNTSYEATNTQKVQQLSDEQLKALFNVSFDSYMGKYTPGIQVKLLLTTIKSSNEKNESHKVEALVNGESTLKNSAIDTSHTYNVSFEYDSDGYITKAIINEN